LLEIASTSGLAVHTSGLGRALTPALVAAELPTTISIHQLGKK
jgi:hypothetical protein